MATEDLRFHILPPDVLPYAPRQPFAPYAPDALSAGAALTAQWPEKRGLLSHVVRCCSAASQPFIASDSTVIEAHFDAIAIPPELGDRLVALGFEPDGFARFVPAHFATHHTLKFKTDRRDQTRRRALRAETEQRCAMLIKEMETRWTGIEAYLELEVYTSASRRRWDDGPLSPAWRDALPLASGALMQLIPPCTLREAHALDVPLDLSKRADIHLKVQRGGLGGEREDLITALETIGFYRVLTWAGNDVLTAQFASSADARRCFELFRRFFDQVGGCAELTMEPVAKVWRSSTAVNGETHLGALPPLVMSINNERQQVFEPFQMA